MKNNNLPNFNTSPLLSEIETVLNNGISNILNDFSERYNLLEKTQSKILKLLKSNKNLNYTSDTEDDDVISNNNEIPEDTEEDVPIFVSIKDMTEEIVKHEVSQYQTSIENKFNKFVDDNNIIVLKLIDQIDSLKQEILKLHNLPQKTQEISEIPKIIETLEKPKIKEKPEKPEIKEIIEITETLEKENIMLKLEEKESDDEEEEKDVEDKEEEKEESPKDNKTIEEEDDEADDEADEEEAEEEADEEAEEEADDEEEEADDEEEAE
jgi:hypothetical protein